MSDWQPARDVVMTYVPHDKVEAIDGTAASADHHLVSARGALESARREVSHNAESAYVMAYDAARKAAVAILAQQGLRSKGGGHHTTVQEIVRSQCGGAFENLDTMRRRRNEIEYPMAPGGGPDTAEAAEAIDWAGAMIDHADAIKDDLPVFDIGENAN